jgi:hypothetical protein
VFFENVCEPNHRRGASSPQLVSVSINEQNICTSHFFFFLLLPSSSPSFEIFIYGSFLLELRVEDTPLSVGFFVRSPPGGNVETDGSESSERLLSLSLQSLVLLTIFCLFVVIVGDQALIITAIHKNKISVSITPFS